MQTSGVMRREIAKLSLRTAGCLTRQLMCEAHGRPLRHCERSEAIHAADAMDCFVANAPRNDGVTFEAAASR
jgi:hypothetical protein